MRISRCFGSRQLLHEPVQAQISINGNTSLSINNPQQTVAYVAVGLITSDEQTNFGFLQCTR